jgi:hypothetical protein
LTLLYTLSTHRQNTCSRVSASQTHVMWHAGKRKKAAGRWLQASSREKGPNK